METFVIIRRRGWAGPSELEAAAGRSTEVGAQMSDDVRWIRTYVLEEQDGTLGSVCIYQATSAEAIHRHSDEAVLPEDEIVRVADLVVVNPDPETVAS